MPTFIWEVEIGERPPTSRACMHSSIHDMRRRSGWGIVASAFDASVWSPVGSCRSRFPNRDGLLDRNHATQATKLPRPAKRNYQARRVTSFHLVSARRASRGPAHGQVNSTLSLGTRFDMVASAVLSRPLSRRQAAGKEHKHDPSGTARPATTVRLGFRAPQALPQLPPHGWPAHLI